MIHTDVCMTVYENSNRNSREIIVLIVKNIQTPASRHHRHNTKRDRHFSMIHTQIDWYRNQIKDEIEQVMV